MSPQVIVTIPPGLEKALGTDFVPMLRTLTRILADELKAFIAPYPSKGPGNVPKAVGSWYERGQGQWYRYADGRQVLKKSSELLDRSWGIRQLGATGAQLGTRGVSYAHWVHSAEDQAWCHAEREWVTDEQAVDKLNASGDIDALVNQMMQKAGLT